MRMRPLLDLLIEQFPEYSRDELYGFVLCREVLVDGGRIANPREPVHEDATLTLNQARFVSRGGEKLDFALRTWQIAVRDRVFLDAGASTGGFTDCLLQSGAAGVYAVDVGYNQLSYRLRTDSRVVVMEKTNIMHVENLDPLPAAAVADLSFRSIRGAASKILSMTELGWMIALIKPQFEVDPGTEGFSGVITSAGLLQEVLQRTLQELEEEHAGTAGLLSSPITGRRGNREFLALLFDMERYPGISVCRDTGCTDSVRAVVQGSA